MLADPSQDGLPAHALLPQMKPLFWMAIDEDYRDDAQIDQISAETELSSLPLDSLATIELMYGIEETFGVYISEEQASDFRTVGDIMLQIHQLTAAKAGSTLEQSS